MTPLLAVALLVLLGILGLWLLGEFRTLVGTGGRCGMCQEWKEYRCPNIVGGGEAVYPDQYACIYYRRKWWLVWCSREAPGSGSD